MDTAAALAQARAAAGLTQAGLAARAGTSQATVCAYELGTKRPSIETFERLLDAMGQRLEVVAGARSVREPSRRELARAGRQLVEVIALAEMLSVRHERELRFPRLPEAA